MAVQKKTSKPVRKNDIQALARILPADLVRQRGEHFEMKIGGRRRRLTEVPFDPENPSTAARAAFPQIGEDPGPEWITMQEAKAVIGLQAKEILVISAVKRRTVGRTHLIHLPSLRQAIAEALRSRFLSPSSTRARHLR